MARARILKLTALKCGPLEKGPMTEDAAHPAESCPAVTALISVRPRTDLRTGLIVSGRIDAPPLQTAGGRKAARRLWPSRCMNG
jgi:hypothetical protein